MVADALRETPDRSDRMIAAAVGVDHKTVGKVRAELAGRAEIPHVEKRTDSIGRKQPATKPDPADTPTGSIFDIGDALTKKQVPDRRKAVAELSKEGLSTRKIGEVLGVAKDTVRNDLAGEKSPPASVKQAKADDGGGEKSPPRNKPTPRNKPIDAFELDTTTQNRKQRDNKAAAKRQDKARIGELLGEAKPGPKQSSVVTDVSKDDRADFRILARARDPVLTPLSPPAKGEAAAAAAAARKRRVRGRARVVLAVHRLLDGIDLLPLRAVPNRSRPKRSRSAPADRQ